MEPLEKRMDALPGSRRVGYLVGNFMAGTLTIEERDELDAWVGANETNMQLFEEITSEKNLDRFLQWLATRETETKLIELKKRMKFKRRTISIRWWQYAAAACLIGLAAWFIYQYEFSKKTEPDKLVAATKDILPGSPVAELLLPGGKRIRLDDIKDTIIDGITVKDGEVFYDDTIIDTALHEIVIPRKGFYKLVLPDGTRVWLNSESSIQYPGSFTKNTREVTVTGETYFEVAKDAAHPFIVSVNGTKVQAIGTAFNINGFDNKITLTEGIIKVSANGNEKIVEPGEQWSANGRVNKIDIAPVIGWTKNQFRFKNLPIEEIMKQLERWYDCSVNYEDKITYHFNGTIDRNVPVSRVLELLEGTDYVHFSIKDNTIIVKK